MAPLLSVALLGCETDVDSPFTNVSAGGSGTATVGTSTTDASTTGDPVGSSSDGSTSEGSSGTTTDASTGDPTAAGTSAADPCTPDPCVAPEVCVDGACVGVPAPAPGELVITELQPDPDAVPDETGEWFEVLNLSRSALELGGCELADQGTDDHTIVGSLVIEAGAYAVLGRSASDNGGLALDYVYGTDISLGNSGDELAIRCGGALVDEVVYLGSWPFSAGAAMQLHASAGADNDDVGQWCEATSTYGDGDAGTPGSTNGACMR